MIDLMDEVDRSYRLRKATRPEAEPWLEALSALDPLRSVPTRSTTAERDGQAAFLSEVRALGLEHELAPGSSVSQTAGARHPVWKVIPFQKELRPMNAFATIALILSLAFGGAGVTAVAAQTSQPDEALYGVKLATEDLRLGLSSGPEARLALALNLMQARTQEMTNLAESDRPIPQVTATRLQAHVETALRAAAELDDAALVTALAQIQERSQAQAQTLARLRNARPEDSGLQSAEAALLQMRTLAELGEQDVTQFRLRARNGQPTEDATETPEVTTAPDEAGVPAATATPVGPGYGYGPGTGECQTGTTCTPELDGNGYGPGTGECQTGTTCTPELDGNSYGPGPRNPAATPGTGQATPQPAATADPGGYGPGPDATQPSGTCTPELDGNSYGPGAGNPEVTPDGDHTPDGSGPAGTPQPGNGRP